MHDLDQPGRQLKFTLVARDSRTGQPPDPSILDIVRVAVEDGLRTPVIGTTTAADPADEPRPASDGRRVLVSSNITRPFREQIEEALAKVVEEFQASGKEPQFDPAKWAEQLSKVWDVIRRMKARGVELELPQAEPLPPADGV